MPGANERRREIVRKAGEAVSEKLSDLWWTFFLRGVVALLLGVAALFWPTGSISLLLKLFGVYLILDGALSIFGVRQQEGNLAEGSPSVITIILGLVLLFIPATSARVAFVLLGLWAGVTGAGYLMTWWRMPASDPERATTRTIGIAALVAGLVLVFWPGTGLVALGWMLALLAFAVCAVMFFLASRFKRLSRRLAG